MSQANKQTRHLLIAVDTGGTFTDFYVVEAGRIRTHKVLSTPDDPSRAIQTGLKVLGLTDGEIVHGSTVATNALLEHKGARVALICTDGFEDVIEIGRQKRDELYNIFVERTKSLVTKRDRFGAPERIDFRGHVIKSLQKKGVRELVQRLKRSRVESIAICMLHSYANGRHEKELGEFLRPLGLPLSLSSTVCPEFREYERTSTTCVNAYVAPIMTRYLKRLHQKVPHTIRVMQSNGGSLSIDEASQEAVRTLLSGPAGGALGALQSGQLSGYSKLLALDMGGTSTDLTLIDKDIELTSEADVGGYPIKTPMIRIHTIGAGGGSIARMDSGGALRVGPESAGAAPGPICYGQGGDECTITDAHLWLGRLHPNHFLGGTMSLQAKRVAAPMKRLAKQLGLSADETADGIIQVANANMSRALRVISLERGYDPREFTLVAFGGAGGLHACELAESLAIPRVLIPAHPGILSAFGMAYADWKRDYVYTVLYTERSDTYERLHKVLERLKGQAHRDAKKQGYQQKQLRYQAELDLRYVGQSFELRVPFKKSYARLFMQQHQHRFGYTHKGKPLEIVNVRLQVRVKLNVGAGSPRPKLRHLAGAGTAPLQAKLNPIERSRLYWRKKSWKVNWYDRSQLSIGTKLVGPVHIAEYSATTFVPPGWKLECDQEENMILTPWKR